MVIETLKEYIERICKIMKERTYLEYFVEDDGDVRILYAPLHWNMYIHHELFREMYDICASAEYGYYYMRRMILDDFVKVLFRNEDKM